MLPRRYPISGTYPEDRMSVDDGVEWKFRYGWAVSLADRRRTERTSEGARPTRRVGAPTERRRWAFARQCLRN